MLNPPSPQTTAKSSTLPELKVNDDTRSAGSLAARGENRTDSTCVPADSLGMDRKSQAKSQMRRVADAAARTRSDYGIRMARIVATTVPTCSGEYLPLSVLRFDGW